VKSILIADSGGTSTEWCFVDESGHQSFFSTESYHPSNWSNEFTERITSYWNVRDKMKSSELHFFGAGCLHSVNSKKIEQIFSNIGFSDISVKSDLHAAALGILGKENGSIAIMGTGSVLFNWVGGEVLNIIGGIGHELGDEGSGYYFGKLIYEAYLNLKMSDAQKEVFERKVDVSAIRDSIGKKSIKYQLANLALLLRKDSELFEEYHRENIERFWNTHLKNGEVSNLNLVGSYAYHNLDQIQPAFAKFNVKIEKVVGRPIVDLVERTVSDVD
jgi:N-acetylglucosamine kinase-like BadF-type ATPase